MSSSRKLRGALGWKDGLTGLRESSKFQKIEQVVLGL